MKTYFLQWSTLLALHKPSHKPISKDLYDLFNNVSRLTLPSGSQPPSSLSRTWHSMHWENTIKEISTNSYQLIYTPTRPWAHTTCLLFYHYLLKPISLSSHCPFSLFFHKELFLLIVSNYFFSYLLLKLLQSDMATELTCKLANNLYVDKPSSIYMILHLYLCIWLFPSSWKKKFFFPFCFDSRESTLLIVPTRKSLHLCLFHLFCFFSHPPSC